MADPFLKAGEVGQGRVDGLQLRHLTGLWETRAGFLFLPLTCWVSSSHLAILSPILLCKFRE